MADIATRRKRGRPPLEDLNAKRERLQKELAAVTAALREAEQRKLAKLGAAVVAEAGKNPALKAQLVDIVSRRVKSADDKAEIEPIIEAA